MFTNAEEAVMSSHSIKTFNDTHILLSNVEIPSISRSLG